MQATRFDAYRSMASASISRAQATSRSSRSLASRRTESPPAAPMQSFNPVFAGFVLLLQTLGAADSWEGRARDLFRVHQAQDVALSPDGRHFAFTQHQGTELQVVVVDVERLEKTATISVEDGRTLNFSKEKEPPGLRFLRWATDTRLVFAPTPRSIPAPPVPDFENGGAMPSPGGPHIIAPIFAIDADGKNPRQLVDARDFEVILEEPPQGAVRDDGRPPPPMVKRSRLPNILGLEDNQPSQLLVEARGFTQGRTLSRSEVHRVDIFTGKSAYVGGDSPTGTHVYDKQGNARIFIPRRFGTRDEIEIAAKGSSAWKRFPTVIRSWAPALLRPTVSEFYSGTAFTLGLEFGGDTIYIGAFGDRDTFSVFSLPALTDSPRLVIGHPTLDVFIPTRHGDESGLIFDRHERRLVGARSMVGPALWIDEELGGLQTAANRSFPERLVDVLEWNRGRTRFLLKVSGAADPGRYFVFFRQQGRMREITRAAPWIDGSALHLTRHFFAKTTTGLTLSGFITIPRTKKTKAAPLIIKFAPGLPATPHPVYDPEAQLFADMGFVVVRLNQRGTQGFGRRFRDAVTEGVEEAAAADAQTIIAWASAETTIDTKRVALVGEGFGGLLALKALKARPDAFRCAVTFDAPIVPDTWLPDIADNNVERQARRKRLEWSNPDVRQLSALHAATPTSKPVFLAIHAVNDGSNAANTRSLHARLQSAGVAAELEQFGDDFVMRLPGASAKVYRRVEEFLNANLYDFSVQLGDPVQVR